VRHALPSPGLRPASEYRPSAVHRRARSPEVLEPSQRNHAAESHHSRTSPYPGHVAPSRLPCVSAPCSLASLPGVFQPGALTGLYPSELDMTQIAGASRRWQALLRLASPGLRLLSMRARCPMSILPMAASLQGLPPCQLRQKRESLSASLLPWLSWVLPPWGFPLSCSNLSVMRASRCLSTRDPGVSFAGTEACALTPFGITLSTSGKAR